MRVIKYLSPTSIGLWEADQEEFYLRYLADDRPERLKQTHPMAVGSAFDAHVKSYLHRMLNETSDPAFEFETLFEKQVEIQNRDRALIAGKYVFEAYKISGALADCLLLMKGGAQFEFTVTGQTEGQIGDVVFMGIPDAHFKTVKSTDVILDWKVNGFYSTKSPSPGYVKIRDGFINAKPSRNNNNAHKDCFVYRRDGVGVNVNCTLDKTDPVWARQLSIYAWMIGCPVGSDFIVAIDQLCCKPDQFMAPQIRVAEFRSLVSPEFQKQVFDSACNIWSITHSDHIFRHMSKDESGQRCATLDKMGATLRGGDEWFRNITRGG